MAKSKKQPPTCQWCREAFVPSPYNKIVQKFCTDRCRRAHWQFLKSHKITLDSILKFIKMAEKGQIDKHGFNLEKIQSPDGSDK